MAGQSRRVKWANLSLETKKSEFAVHYTREQDGLLIMQLESKCKTASVANSSKSWIVVSGEAYFEMAMPLDGMSAGWRLVRGTLLRSGGDYDARLYYDLGKGFGEESYFPIPTSGKGTINEVIHFPAGVRRIMFVPMRSAGEFELSGFSFADIGVADRIWRMARRIMKMIWLHPRSKRQPLGLSLFRMLVDLQGAYDAANKLRAHAAAPNYSDWLAKFDTHNANDDRLIDRDICTIKSAPHFNVLVVTDGVDHGAVQKTLHSLDAQAYRVFTYTVLTKDAADHYERDDGDVASYLFSITPAQMTAWLEKFRKMLATKNGQEWVIVLRAGQLLASHALYWFASEAVSKPDATVIYADDDELDANGQRCRPRFKPDFSLAHLHATNFVGDAVALRAGAVISVGGLNRDCVQHGNYDLLLRVVDALGDDGQKKIVHIPGVLLHDARTPGGASETSEWCMNSLRAHFSCNGIAVNVSGTFPGCWRVRYRLPEVVPLVSIVVPTRDKLELIRHCLGSVLEKTSYPNYEILVVDNQSSEPEVLAFLERMSRQEKVRVLRYDLPFNFSAMNNMAVQQARGEAICLLNNDTEVISPDWIEEMLGHLLQPKVGVVGAKLYFRDGRVQHAGDLVGVGGVANHAQLFLQRDEPGYCNRAMVAQEMSAVTAACLVTWRKLYLEQGGLDEQHLPVSFNDVDYCLKVRSNGYRVVWTPHAELYHYESMSRGKDLTSAQKRLAKQEVSYMRKNWKHVLHTDPYYNPNLSYERPDFSLNHAPMVKKPWR